MLLTPCTTWEGEKQEQLFSFLGSAQIVMIFELLMMVASATHHYLVRSIHFWCCTQSIVATTEIPVLKRKVGQ